METAGSNGTKAKSIWFTPAAACRGREAKQRHGLGLSDMVRQALASDPSEADLRHYLPTLERSQVRLTSQQWQQIQGIARTLGVTQAEATRALHLYQLDRLNMGPP